MKNTRTIRITRALSCALAFMLLLSLPMAANGTGDTGDAVNTTGENVLVVSIPESGSVDIECTSRYDTIIIENPREHMKFHNVSTDHQIYVLDENLDLSGEQVRLESFYYYHSKDSRNMPNFVIDGVTYVGNDVFSYYGTGGNPDSIDPQILPSMGDILTVIAYDQVMLGADGEIVNADGVGIVADKNYDGTFLSEEQVAKLISRLQLDAAAAQKDGVARQAGIHVAELDGAYVLYTTGDVNALLNGDAKLLFNIIGADGEHSEYDMSGAFEYLGSSEYAELRKQQLILI